MGITVQQITVVQGTGKGRGPRDGPSLQSLGLRLNDRDNSYVAKRDLGPGRRSDLPKGTLLLAVKLGLESSLLPSRWTQGVGCSGILSVLPAHTDTSTGPGQVMGDGGDMRMG